MFTLSISAQEVPEVVVSYSKSDASLEEIFKDLELQYGIRFSYATSSIEDKKMDVDFKNMSIDEVMIYLLSEASMEYKIVENNILVKKSDGFLVERDQNYNASLHINGKVTNTMAGENLEFATISISNSPIGTYTDEQGNFDIEIPAQYLNENIVIQYIGYEDEVFKIDELEDHYLMVGLDNDMVAIAEIVIVNREKPIRIGNKNNNLQLSSGQIKSATSGVMGSDISRQIQLLPGIAAHDDNSAEIKIRGSNGDETLMVLDGMPIYNADHYYGIFSGINTAFVDSVNIYKNTYPLHYGGRTAGLVELFSERNQPVSTSMNLNLDLLTASADGKLPVSENSHIAFAGRSTIKKVNNQQFNTVTGTSPLDPMIQSFGQRIDDRRNDPDFTFYDVNLRYQFQNKKKDQFSINFFRSRDVVENRYKISVLDNKLNELKLVAIDDQTWSNTAASILWSKGLGHSSRLNTTAFFTNYMNEEINDLKLDKKNKNGGPLMNLPLMADLSAKQTNNISDLGIDTYLDVATGKGLFKIGLMTTYHDIQYKFDDNRKEKLKGNDEFFEMAAYTGYDMNLWANLNLSAGLRTTYFSNLEEIKLSPRVLLNYIVNDHLSLKSSFNIENQVVRQLYYEYRGVPTALWVTAGQNDIPVLRSENYMVGTTIKMMPFALDVEIFRKDMKGQLEYLLPNPGDVSNNSEQMRDYRLFKGNGKARGIDIILSSGYKNYDTYVSYTLSKNEQQFKQIDQNNFFASENDRRHQLKWVNTLNTGNFSWGLNAIYVSGRPYTDVRKVAPGSDITLLEPSTRLERLPAYHRVDISAAYNFNIGKYNASVSASVFNLLNTQNVQYIQSVTTQVNDNQKTENIIVGNESELLNRTINFGISIGF